MRGSELRAKSPGEKNGQPRTRIKQTNRNAKNELTERLATVKHGCYWGGGPIAKTGQLSPLNGLILVVFLAKNGPKNGSTGVLVEWEFGIAEPSITIPPTCEFKRF